MCDDGPLKELTVKELEVIAKRLKIRVPGLKKSDLIREIMEVLEMHWRQGRQGIPTAENLDKIKEKLEESLYEVKIALRGLRFPN